VWKYSVALGRTQNNIAAINMAIANYFYDNGRYPCPALLNIASNQANYGKQNCAGTTAGTIRSGSVPFVDLKIPMEMALDGWKNRIDYTVAVSLSDPATAVFPTTINTDISVLRFLPIDPATGGQCPGGENMPMVNTHFVLVSHGETGAGATSADGNLVATCPAGGAASVESENCNADTVFRSDICARSNANNASYYDDVVFATNTPPQRIWVYSTAAGNDPSDIVSTIPQIGINNPDPFGNTGQAGLDVRGNIVTGDGGANLGAIVADTMCDVNAQNCFSPSLIGGPATMMNDCQKNHSFGMRGIWNGTEASDSRAGARVRCQNSFTPSAANVCAPKYAIGFEQGKIKCAP
jgi:type II secretory pathway pseudopilin PulG